MDLGPLHGMAPSRFAELLDEAEPDDRPALLRERFRTNLDEFCKYCWPDRFCLGFNKLHDELFAKQLVQPWTERNGLPHVKDATAAPRGFAKSTITTFARIVHDVVYDREAYIVLISEELGLSRSLSEDLRQQFKGKDTPLARLYGPFQVTGGVDAWRVSVRGRPTVGLLSKSFGSSVRGTKHPTRGIRPTKVVIDDGENVKRVRNPDQRQVWWNYLTKDVLKLGDRGRATVFEVVGTVLHVDSMLARLLVDLGWTSKRWQAIESWPERTDLWERCRLIWTNLTLGAHRRAAAHAFYRANQAEMERGAKILDPASKSLFDLYEMIWSDGLSSFLQEMQNDPVDPASQIFFSEKFARFTIDGPDLVVTATGRRVPLSSLRLHGHWDPATGSPHGDFAAIAIVGRDGYGYSYLLDCWVRRAKPSEQLNAAWVLAERWNLGRMTVESNGFQELVATPFTRERRERRDSGKFWKLQLRPENTSENKELRIATLEPDATNGWLLFRDGLPVELLQQFDQFPDADHDDGPDAVHAAWSALGGSPAQMVS